MNIAKTVISVKYVRLMVVIFSLNALYLAAKSILAVDKAP
jgi:hypothetical protein